MVPVEKLCGQRRGEVDGVDGGSGIDRVHGGVRSSESCEEWTRTRRQCLMRPGRAGTDEV